MDIYTSTSVFSPVHSKLFLSTTTTGDLYNNAVRKDSIYFHFSSHSSSSSSSWLQGTLMSGSPPNMMVVTAGRTPAAPTNPTRSLVGWVMAKSSSQVYHMNFPWEGGVYGSYRYGNPNANADATNWNIPAASATPVNIQNNVVSFGVAASAPILACKPCAFQQSPRTLSN